MIVMKFGGSSLADAVRLRQVGRLVGQALPRSPLVVLSALDKTTDALEAAGRRAEEGDVGTALEVLRSVIAQHRQVADELFRRAPEGRPPCAPSGPREIDAALGAAGVELERLLGGVAALKELTPRTLDTLLAFGELLSTRLFALWFGAKKVDAGLFLRTDRSFGRARPDRQTLERLAREHLLGELQPGRAVVTQGFLGATEEGQTTTLGRGGSDFSASLLGAALEAEEVQIWTDVEGVFTCDPRLVPEARPLPELSFEEASELAAFGARVLHPASIQPAVAAHIPVTVRHTLKPDGAFTTISGGCLSKAGETPGELSGDGAPAQPERWALAGRGPLTVLTVTSARMLHQSGFLARLFEVFGRHDVSVDLVTTAEVSVSLTVEESAPLETLVAEISEFASVKAVPGRALVAVVSHRLKQIPGLAGRIFGSLRSINVEMISMGANDINLSLIVLQEQMVETLRCLHRVLEGAPASPPAQPQPVPREAPAAVTLGGEP